MGNEDALLVLVSAIVEHEGGEYRVPVSARQALSDRPRALEVYVDDNEDLVLSLIEVPEDVTKGD